jgi:hypothetical protein
VESAGPGPSPNPRSHDDLKPAHVSLKALLVGSDEGKNSGWTTTRVTLLLGTHHKNGETFTVENGLEPALPGCALTCFPAAAFTATMATAEGNSAPGARK